MTPTYENSLDLLTGVSKEPLYQALIHQLNKDFYLAGIDVTLENNQSPQQLKETIEEIVSQLITNDFNSFLNLLYRIDIPENKVLNYESFSIEVYTKKVAFVILKRIWKKVWLKNNYSKLK
ncbi:conserved hypothetical protein [Tenacibaculum sp. 190524A02b]|uniref:Uncharacterized protein n=1 Tax=Tenacibaculum vairaonense TaxID=3137860 RepID=A0ABP1FE17_9FLAO